MLYLNVLFGLNEPTLLQACQDFEFAVTVVNKHTNKLKYTNKMINNDK